MKNTFFILLKPLSFAPAIAMMVLIFHFSAQPADVSSSLSYEVSYDLVQAKDQLLRTGLSYDELYWQAGRIHHYVRKAAHFTEYLLLALAVSFPFYVYGIRGIRLLLLTFVICVGYAGLDEFHQTMVEARSPSYIDVAIDGVGALTGALLVQAFCWSASHNPAGRK